MGVSDGRVTKNVVVESMGEKDDALDVDEADGESLPQVARLTQVARPKVGAATAIAAFDNPATQTMGHDTVSAPPGERREDDDNSSKP